MEFKERRLAIVLLDLIGSTAFVQKVGARKAAEWLQYHDRLTRSLIYKFQGREIDRSDGFMLSFDRCIDAVNFGLHYQDTIPKKTKIGARIGIHWGSIIEVVQDELFIGIGAKSVELEGISKNIAARTMSLCGAGQVLLTKEAMQVVKHRTNSYTPKNTRYALAGEYKFKGVRKTQIVFTVGTTIESLQPPKGSDKVKRIGGAKRIKARLRDKKFKELAWFILSRTALIWFCYLLTIFAPFVIDPHKRRLSELTWFAFVDPLIEFLKKLMSIL